MRRTRVSTKQSRGIFEVRICMKERKNKQHARKNPDLSNCECSFPMAMGRCPQARPILPSNIEPTCVFESIVLSSQPRVCLHLNTDSHLSTNISFHDQDKMSLLIYAKDGGGIDEFSDIIDSTATEMSCNERIARAKYRFGLWTDPPCILYGCR